MLSLWRLLAQFFWPLAATDAFMPWITDDEVDVRRDPGSRGAQGANFS